GSMFDSAALQVSCSPRPGAEMAALEAALDAEMARFLSDGPTEAELTRAKTRLMADTIFSRDSQSTLARIFGAALAVGETIEDVLAWPARIEAVTAEAITEAVRRHLDPKRSVTGLLLPG
ncbi:MAG: insulinase family protein, partial [Bosea sp. (in: a-proteobacteria)]